jgi:P-type Cu2+ transporter
MKTSIIEVSDMLSILTVDEVEKRFGEVSGVASATVNYAAGNATVRYDETLLEVAGIKVLIHQRGQPSVGESQAKDVREDKHEHKPAVKQTPETAPASTSPPEPAVPKAAPATPADAPKSATPTNNGQQDKKAPAAPPSTTSIAAKEE